MEKITCAPLVRLLRDKRELCNLRFSAASVRYPSLFPDRVKALIHEVMQPVIKGLEMLDPAEHDRIFDQVYDILLDLEGSGRMQAAGDVYRQTLMLIPSMAHTVWADGDVLLIRHLIRAATTIHSGYPQATPVWIEAMGRAMPHCGTAAQVLDAGRVCAWMSGLAHLREHALKALDRLCKEGVTAIFYSPRDTTIDRARFETDPWYDPRDAWSMAQADEPVFRYRTGGFQGQGGPFLRPPVSASLDGRCVVTDGESVLRVFADAFGVSFINDTTLSVDDVQRMADRPANNLPKLGRNLALSDIRSRTVLGHTLFLTRDSSHFLYVYACHES